MGRLQLQACCSLLLRVKATHGLIGQMPGQDNGKTGQLAHCACCRAETG